MRALQLITPGLPIEQRDVASPEPGPDDVVVDVAAAGAVDRLLEATGRMSLDDIVERTTQR